MVWRTDSRGRVDYANARYVAFAAAAASAAAARPPRYQSLTMHPDDLPELQQKQAEAMQQGLTLKHPVRLLRPADATWLRHIYHLVPLRDEHQQIARLLGTCTDIDAQWQQAERERCQRQQSDRLNHELVEKRSVRERFVATLFHDLLSPLSAGRLTAQSMQRLARSERMRQLVERLNKILTRTTAMIGELLTANRLKAGQPLQLSMQAADLVAVLKPLILDLADLHGGRVSYLGPASCPGFFTPTPCCGWSKI